MERKNNSIWDFYIYILEQAWQEKDFERVKSIAEDAVIECVNLQNVDPFLVDTIRTKVRMYHDQGKQQEALALQELLLIAQGQCPLFPEDPQLKVNIKHPA